MPGSFRFNTVLWVLSGVLTGLTVLIVAVGLAVRRPETEASLPTTACADSSMAYVVAWDSVKARLVLPATAEFPSLGLTEGVASRHIGNCRHRITGYVDSEDLLGTVIRTKYAATIRYAGDDRWSVEEVSFVD